MNKWPISSLKGKIQIKHGYPFKSEFFSAQETKYIVLTPGNFYEKGGFKRQVGKEKFYTGEILEDYLHKKDDLIVAMTEQAEGLLGSCARVPESGIYLHNQRLGLITTDPKKILKEYVYYLFKTKTVREQIRLTSSGSKVKHTSPERIYEVQVPLPNINEQQKIVDLLDAIEDKVELNNLIKNELEDMAKTLYDYWFVQFDFPDSKSNPYKTSGGKMVYNSTLKRDIPEGWDVDNLASLIKSTKTGDWGKDEKQEKYNLSVNCIRGADINGLNGNGKVDPPLRFINEKNKNKILISFEIIVEISGGSPTQSTGRVTSLIDESFERFNNPLICSNFCKALSLVDNSFFYYFVGLWDKLYKHDVFFGWEGKTSGIKNLLFDAFIGKYYVAIPPKEIAQKFFEKIHSLNVSKQNIMLQNRNLQSLRDWLLPMLMNGQISIRDAEEHIVKTFE